MSSSPQSSAPTLAPTSTALTVVGSINLDITATASRLPTPGETVGGAILRQQPGGKGANQAVAAARLAGASRMVGAVGRDETGRTLLEVLSGLPGASLGPGECEISLSTAGPSRAKLLDLRPSEPVLVLTQYVRRNGSPFYLAKCLVAAKAGHLSVIQSS